MVIDLGPSQNAVSDLRSLYPIEDSVRVADLSTFHTIRIANGASGILVQAFVADVHFAISKDSTIEADASDFVISASSVVPALIEIQEGLSISFLEAASDAEVTYQMLR